MNRIASDEPDQVTVIPQPITFWHRGQRYQAAVASSAIAGRMNRDYGINSWYPLKGDFGRAWLADPCTMALHESLHESRLAENQTAKADRYARRQAKAALEQEAILARQKKSTTW